MTDIDDNDKDNVIDAQHLDEALQFETALRATGREHYVKGDKLMPPWPSACWKYLTPAERDFRSTHREALKEIVRRKLLPETQVVWVPPTGTPAELTKADSLIADPGRDVRPPNLAAATPGSPTTDVCPYCMRKCVGPNNIWYGVMHWSDPEQIAKRHAEGVVQLAQHLRAE
jgi:hypothetical protein